MALYDPWKTQVLARLPGAVTTFVELEAKSLIHDFCKESTAWRGMVRDYDITINDPLVPLNPIVGMDDREVIGIQAVYRNDVLLPSKNHVPVLGADAYWAPSGDDPSVIELSYTPTATDTGAIAAWVCFRPADDADADDLPAILTKTYFENILDGILGRMFSQTDKPYTSRIMAEYHLRRYRAKTREALNMTRSAFASNAQEWTYPSFGR